ncbi:putative transcriptional repressor protein korC (plasmid) [Burkholderia gladioli]|uniref:Transcriptional repressor protein korC n=1 Tax=Burkholderia gladioli TaxID=28095 RepID=A0AAW3FBB8_BURGA|nr:putative transcriptional repressor protein korC [Burkholderia gladioli]AWY53054.1 transcriptional regulator [Burkholderia gladioli pv. gladioli]KGC24043.1 putative transcriptional repressor protein korC [Burkholderia gladioli]
MEKHLLEIRRECLQPATYWIRPRGAEVQEVLRRANLSPPEAAAYLGVATASRGRQVRKWMSEEAPITYAAWALLCDAAGFVPFWRLDHDK